MLFFLFLFVQKKRIQFAVSYIGDKASFTLTCKIDDRFNLTTVGVGQIVHLFQKNCQEKKKRKKTKHGSAAKEELPDRERTSQFDLETVLLSDLH